MSNVFSSFLTDSGLYDKITITENNIEDLCSLLGGRERISVYCQECGEDRVFMMQDIPIFVPVGNGFFQPASLSMDLLQYQNSIKLKNTPGILSKPEKDEWTWTYPMRQEDTRVIHFAFVCAMDFNHRLDYIVRTDGYTMRKIGQYPSVADVSFPELDEYKKVIDSQSRREMRRAIGLYAQGIGVGSFVYLRRVFERILDEAKTKAESDNSLNLSEYPTMKVVEKIKLLKNYLPDMINENPVIYGIVSKGIHELSEDECNQYFPVLRESIFVILQQWNEIRKSDEAKKSLCSELSKIASEVF